MDTESHTTPGQVTQLLSECSAGDRSALDRLLPLVYDDLRSIARGRLRHERDDHTLSTDALVHEAYIRLVDQRTATWQDRAHFFALSATVIRRVLVDHARARNAGKRRGSVIRIPLSEDLDGEHPKMIELLTLDEALDQLAEHDERLRKVVECRFFAGMTSDDTAEALGVSTRTIERDWTRAKAYLYRLLAPEREA